MTASRRVRRGAPVLPIVLLLLTGCAGPTAVTPGSHTATSWRVTTSEGYEALCIMNGLGGDPFCVQYYRGSVAEVRAALPEDALRAAERLTARKQRFGFILSAFTTLLAFTGLGEMIDEVIAFFERPGEVMRRYRATSYYRVTHGLLFRLGVRRDALIVLRGLRAVVTRSRRASPRSRSS